MKNYKILTVLALYMVSFTLWGQTITVSGKIEDEQGNPVSDADIKVYPDNLTVSDSLGKYSLIIPANTQSAIGVTHLGYEIATRHIPPSQKNVIINFTLKSIKEKALPEVVFTGTRRKTSDLTSVRIDAGNVKNLPSLSGGIEEILNTAFVSTASELSSYYRVRGGNYDENLVYINGVEVYKPLTVRSGQQEGMSIINPDMVSTVSFSAGGFEAGYGDKMSSVLDITYRQPKKFETSIEASLLGGSATVGFATRQDKEQKFSGMVGGRYRNTSLILNTLNGDTNYDPEYFDVQTYLQYTWDPKWNLSFLGIYSSNDYTMVPKSREIDFGTLYQPIKLNIAYNGREKDQYRAANGILSLQFRPSNDWAFNLSSYAVHSKEQEYFDIASGYVIQEADAESGGAVSTFGTGGQIDHGRNNLDMMLAGAHFKAKYNLNVNSAFEAGFQYQHEDIRNLKNQWQLLDSLGYSIPRPVLPPGDLDNSDLILNYPLTANNNLKSNRINGYFQYTSKFMWNTTRVLVNAGVRATYWDFNGETDISPRAQIAIKPDWNMDMLFRFATGLYYQPPFYKEALRLDGSLNENIKSQRSIHFILGNDYEFKMLNKRPFKLTTEIYYKKLDDLIPYFMNNVQVIYTGENNSKGYAYGIDARLNGEFVPGAESWLSLSYGRTEENIDGQGYIPRPTDPRFKAGLFFQDYMKQYPQLKASVTLVYASGLPTGAPPYTNPYNYQSTLSDYKRADVGLTYVFVDQKLNKAREGSTLDRFKELSLGLEIFNVFDVRNTISNLWIRDVTAAQPVYYAVPNKLTGRFFNVKLNARF